MAAVDDKSAQPLGSGPHTAGDAASHSSQKSYRRKYLKIRHFYKGVMNDSNSLIREEERMKALARRLQEQVDELQDALLDLNDEPKLPSFLRIDLGAPSVEPVAITSIERESQGENIDQAQVRRLKSAQKKYAKGRYSMERYGAVEAELVSALPHAGPKTLSSLLSVPHTHYPADSLPDDLIGDLDDLPGFLSPSHEATHIDALEKAMADPLIYNPHDKSGKPIVLGPRNRLSDKDLSLVNPVSPLNWLRRYQPQVFLQDPKPDGEDKPEKSTSKAAGGRKRGRQSEPGPREPKGGAAEHEGEEDSNFVPEFGGRGKRNKEDEPYRPKGGSSRGSKRKRVDDGETGGARKKAQKGSRASMPS